MTTIAEFAARVEEQLKCTNSKPHWSPAEADRYMAEIDGRRRRFEGIAAHLSETVIHPRLDTYASYFPNATLTNGEPVGHSACCFGYRERFPTSTRVAFSVEHDVCFEHIAVCYIASMMPQFIRFNEHDRITSPLDEVSDDQVANWIEDRLLEFLEAYQRIDRGDVDFEDEPVVDPVCGMRISRSSAAASDSYCGHPSFFCSDDCLVKFQQDSTQFAQRETV